MNGNLVYCQQLVKQYPQHQNLILQAASTGFCLGGYYSLFDQLLSLYPLECNKLINFIKPVLLDNKVAFSNSENCLKILVSLNDNTSNQLLAQFSDDEIPLSISIELIEIKDLMRKNLNFEQSFAWRKSDTQGLLYNRDSLLNAANFPFEIFSLVSSYVTNLCQADTTNLITFVIKEEEKIYQKKKASQSSTLFKNNKDKTVLSLDGEDLKINEKLAIGLT